LPGVSYWYETWSVALRAEQRLKGFENSGLRKIFGLQLEDVRRNWRKSHEEELHDLLLTKYYYGNQIQEGEISEACDVCQQGVGGGKMLIEFWWGNSRERDKRGT
jgi:hypothetical protein